MNGFIWLGKERFRQYDFRWLSFSSHFVVDVVMISESSCFTYIIIEMVSVSDDDEMCILESEIH